MPQYRIIWNGDTRQRGYSVAPSLLELAKLITDTESFRGEITLIERNNPYPLAEDIRKSNPEKWDKYA
jgi:hypothetical protein